MAAYPLSRLPISPLENRISSKYSSLTGRPPVPRTTSQQALLTRSDTRFSRRAAPSPYRSTFLRSAFKPLAVEAEAGALMVTTHISAVEVVARGGDTPLLLTNR